MGLFDSVLGGGKQVAKTKIEGYIEQPSKAVGYGVRDLLKSQKPIGETEQDAYNRLIGTSKQANPYLSQGNDFYSQLFQQGGLNQEQNDLASQLTTGQNTNPALAETQRVAMGGDVGRNPYLDATFNQAADQYSKQLTKGTVPAMDRQFAASGRLGSHAYADARNEAEETNARGIERLATDVYGGAYQNDMAAKNQALGQFGQLGQAGIQNQLQGANLYSQGTNQQFQGVGLTPTLQGLRYDDASRQLQTGQSMTEAPWLQYQRAAGVVGGLQGATQQTNQASTPVGSQLVGAGAGFLGLPTGSVGGKLFGF